MSLSIFLTILISFISISKSILFDYFALFNILRSFCFSFSLLYLHLLYLFYHLYLILFLYHILLLPHLLNPLHLLGLYRIPHLLNYTACTCDPNSSFLYLIISCWALLDSRFSSHSSKISLNPFCNNKIRSLHSSFNNKSINHNNYFVDITISVNSIKYTLPVDPPTIRHAGVLALPRVAASGK